MKIKCKTNYANASVYYVLKMKYFNFIIKMIVKEFAKIKNTIEN